MQRVQDIRVGGGSFANGNGALPSAPDNGGDFKGKRFSDLRLSTRHWPWDFLQTTDSALDTPTHPPPLYVISLFGSLVARSPSLWLSSGLLSMNHSVPGSVLFNSFEPVTHSWP